MHFPLFKARLFQGTRTKDYDDDNGDLQRGSESNEGPPGGLAEDSSGVLQNHTGGSSEISSATGLYVGEDGEVDILGRMDQPIYQGAPDSSSTPKKQAIDRGEDAEGDEEICSRTSAKSNGDPHDQAGSKQMAEGAPQSHRSENQVPDFAT